MHTLLKNMLFLLLSAGMVAAGMSAAAEPKPKPLVRELFVPFDDLNILLQGDVDRVFLSKKDYEELLAKAKQKPADIKGPWWTNVASGKYKLKIADGRATITGDLQVELITDDLLSVQLQLSGVGLRGALWDDKPAAIGRSPQGPVVFAQGRGTHALKLEMVAPVTESAAQQALQVTLPATASTEMTVVVAGNVELKGGAAVLSRTFDEKAAETTFTIVPPRGPLSLVFSLNNRQKRAERVLVARSVVVDEVTLSYERIHARVAFRVLHGSVDTLKIGVPSGFEVTDVSSPLLARWTAKQEGGQQVLELTLREPALDSVEIDLSAVRLDVDFAKWKFPSLTPQDTAGHVALAAVLLEDRLRLGKLTSEGILPIDAAILAGAIPASVLNAEPGSPSVRQVATYYAPNGQIDLSAPIIRPAEGLRVVASSLLLVEEKQVSVHGGLALSPQAEETFSLALQVPKGWRINEVLHPDGTPVAMEQFDLAGSGTRVLLRFPNGLPIGQTTSLQYLATSVPEGWLSQEQSKKLDFPVIKVEGADRETGAVAIHALDDLKVTPLELTGLLPLLENEKANYGFANLPTTYAYYYDEPPYAAKLQVETVPASLTADIYAFFRVERDHTAVHYEVAFTIRERRTRQLRFYLPSSTPEEISLRGLNAEVKDFTAKDTVGDRRRWVVQLAERQGGVVRLAIDFDLPHGKPEPQDLSLPLLVADDVEYQAALVAVEGSSDLQVEVTKSPRDVDVGELSGADYQLGRRVVGTYGYNGTQAEVKVNVTELAPFPLPIAVVQRAELITIIDPARRNGHAISQSAANYWLRTKATLLEVELPAEATLWTILLDGQPTKPQRQGTKLLVSLPAGRAEVDRQLQLLYEAPSAALSMSGEVRQIAPKLRLPSAQGSVDVDTADLVWRLWVPSRYRVTTANGTVFRDKEPAVIPPILKTAEWLYQGFGSVRKTYPVSNSMRQLGLATHSYRGDYSDYAVTLSEAKKSEVAAGDRFTDGAYYQYNAPMTPPAATPAPSEPRLADEATILSAQTANERPLVAPPTTESVPPPVIDPTGIPTPKSAPMSREDYLMQGRHGFAYPGKTTNGPGELPARPALQVPGHQVAGTPADVLAPNDDGSSFAVGINQQGFIPLSRGWGLEGVRSLPIRLEEPLAVTNVQFTSLGSDPELVVTLVDNRRLDYASWGIGVLIFVVGLWLTCAGWPRKLQYVLLVLIASSVFALLPGIFGDLLPIFDAAFFAGTLTGLYFLAVGALRGCCKICGCGTACRTTPRDELVGIPTNGTNGPSATTASILLLCALFLPAEMFAQDPPLAIVNPPPPPVQPDSVRDLIKALEGGPVPKVPADAVLIPYDPADEEGIAKAEKILVPYAKYIELWNRANPDKKISNAKPPTDYAVGGQSFSATLGDKDQVIVTGKATIHVYKDGGVQIPLRLVGGVIAEARLDGEAARLQTVQPQPAAQPQQQAEMVAPDGGVATPIFMLYAEGKGTKELTLTLRFGVTRQGGWRSMEGVLPVHQAAAFTLEVPEAGSEVRLSHILDRASHKTKAANEKIENALPPNGKFRVEWRPRVAEAQVDPSLTANSKVLFDVREDALRLIWQVNFQFRGAAREQFELGLPAGYLVERVAGENVRGWQTQQEEKIPRLDVTLLKPAAGNETITVYLAKRGAIGEGELAAIAVPIVDARDAVLQQGELLVRRSPRMELQTVRSQGLARDDISPAVAALVQQNEALDASVLTLRQYQAYRFASVPFSLELKAIPAIAEPTAKVQSIMRLAERQTTLETSFELRAGAAPIYVVRALVPKDFDIQSVEPAGVEWSVTPQANQQLVQLLFPQGQEGTTRVTLRGQLSAAGNEVHSPRIEVLDVASQEGELVVQADPEVDILVKELKEGENVFLMQTIHWLRSEQHALAKVAVRYRSPDYQAIFKRSPRTPLVEVQSLTNLKVTQRAVEQTHILDFDVAQAGIHEVVFQLPKMIAKSARIHAQLLQQRLPDEDIAERPGWVRIKLVLQDDLMGQFRVLIEHDGLVSNDKQEIALPKIETGRVSRQFLAIESAGRDEFVVDSSVGLEQAAPQQQAWKSAASILGGNFTAVYAAAQGASESKLLFHLQGRALVKTSEARIGLSDATLIVDASGAYRGQQVYRIQNFTEQYLEVKLPDGASLWTAVVAGEPVKPIPGPSPDQPRIPLVKSAEGEADYEVVLKYAGKLPAPNLFRKTEFPLIKPVKIHPEKSGLALYLPESQQWFDFEGSMRTVEQAEYFKLIQKYIQDQLFLCTNDLDSTNEFVRMRAQNNLKQLRLQDLELQAQSQRLGVDQSKLSELSYSNSGLITEGLNKVEEWNAQSNEMNESDNRARLNTYFNEQHLERSKNVVTKLGKNFDSGGIQTENRAKGDFNGAWFGQNKLEQRTGPATGTISAPESKPAQQRYSRSVKGIKDNVPKDQPDISKEGKEFAPQVAQGKFADDLKAQLDREQNSQQKGSGAQQGEGEQGRNLRNYQQRLDENFEKQVQQGQGLQAGGQSQLGGITRGAAGGSGGAGSGGGGPGGPGQFGYAQNGQPQSGTPNPNDPQQQLDALVQQTLNGSQLANRSGTMGGRTPADGRDGQSNSELFGQAAAGGVALDLPPLPTGMASLDVQLPVRGKVYYFKEVRGATQVTGRAFDKTTMYRGIALLVTLLVATVIMLIVRNWNFSRLSSLGNSLAVDLVVAAVALIAFMASLLPWLSLIVLVIALVRLAARLVAHLQRRRVVSA